MKDYKIVENDVAMVAEPSQPYAAVRKVSKPGRMTVKKYFDEVWERVVEKHESL